MTQTKRRRPFPTRVSSTKVILRNPYTGRYLTISWRPASKRRLSPDQMLLCFKRAVAAWVEDDGRSLLRERCGTLHVGDFMTAVPAELMRHLEQFGLAEFVIEEIPALLSWNEVLHSD